MDDSPLFRQQICSMLCIRRYCLLSGCLQRLQISRGSVGSGYYYFSPCWWQYCEVNCSWPLCYWHRISPCCLLAVSFSFFLVNFFPAAWFDTLYLQSWHWWYLSWWLFRYSQGRKDYWLPIQLHQWSYVLGQHPKLPCPRCLAQEPSRTSSHNLGIRCLQVLHNHHWGVRAKLIYKNFMKMPNSMYPLQTFHWVHL